MTVTPITNYAQYDQQPGPIERAIGADGAAKYNAKLRAMIVSQHTTASTLQQNLSIVSNASTPAAFVVVQTIQPLPGRGNEYNAITEKEYLPIYKKAGFGRSRRRSSGPSANSRSWTSPIRSRRR